MPSSSATVVRAISQPVLEVANWKREGCLIGVCKSQHPVGLLSSGALGFSAYTVWYFIRDSSNNMIFLFSAVFPEISDELL